MGLRLSLAVVAAAFGLNVGLYAHGDSALNLGAAAFAGAMLYVLSKDL